MKVRDFGKIGTHKGHWYWWDPVKRFTLESSILDINEDRILAPNENGKGEDIYRCRH